MKGLLKPYKVVNPVVTVKNIRNILNELGIFIVEEYKNHGDFHVCRIEIGNENLKKYNIGTNGKGSSVEYCYASAYGEFMERLQNNILIGKSFYFSKYFKKNSSFSNKLTKDNLQLNFLFDPKEKEVDIDDIIKDNSSLLLEMMYPNHLDDIKILLKEKLGYSKALCVPFYDVIKNKECYLPIELMLYATGSNGMCAGNTPEEALIQGISEIFERYAVREIHKKNLTPPTIPNEYFKNHKIFNSIKKIEDSGYTVLIKDFSLGIGLPVIATVVINKEVNTYNVKIGSDPYPIIALERCLTELYQSFKGIRLINKIGFGESIQDDYQNISQVNVEHINLRKVFTNATGQWPDSLFGDKNSYEFKDLNFDYGKTNKEDLEFLVKKVKSLDSTLYIRDVSYLGLNSYYVIAPGLSLQKTDFNDYTLFHNFYNKIDDLNNIDSLTNTELDKIVQILEDNYEFIKINYINFKEAFIFNTEKENCDLDLILCLAYIKLEKLSKAFKYIKRFLEDKNRIDYLYFFACKDFIYLKSDKIKSHQEIQQILLKVYSKELVAEVIEDLSSTKNIFKSYNFNLFFDCEDCDIEEFDYYTIANILKKIQLTHLANPINQIDLKDILKTE